MPRPRERMEAQMTAWFKDLHTSKEAERRDKDRPFVTISRECGACGTTVADMLAQYLQKHEPNDEVSWAVYDKELIQKVMEDYNFPAGFESYFAESSTSLIRDVLEELFGLHPPQETLVRSVSNTILHLASSGYVILVGRGANIITRSLPNSLHVRLFGSFEKRVAHMEEYLNLPEEQAREYVMKQDHGRQAYIKQYFQKDISDVSLYDLIINTDRMPCQEVVKIMGDVVLRRHKQQALPT